MRSLYAGLLVLALLVAGCSDQEPAVQDEFGDPDGDGLPNFEERNRGTDPEVPDTDGDSLSDWWEIYRSYSDPLNPDSDNDTLTDDIDPAPMNDLHDEDGDGYLDQFDLWMYKNLTYDVRLEWTITADDNFGAYLYWNDIIFEAIFVNGGDYSDIITKIYDWPDDSDSVRYDLVLEPGPDFEGVISGNILHWEKSDEKPTLDYWVNFTENE